MATLKELPTEILLDVYQNLDLTSISQLALVCQHFHKVFMRCKANILVPVLIREFSPLDELLQVCTASADDIIPGQGLYTRRKIIFKRYLGDTGVVLADVPERGKPAFMNGRGHNATAMEVKVSVLTEKDLSSIIKHCQLVRQWETLFPQMRWFHEPAECRVLRPHESHRLRRALYRWWLYGIHFHGDSPRPRVGLPADFVEDVRTSQLRYHSTSELLELMDFMETIKDVLFHYICPRLDPLQGDSLEQSPLMFEMDRSESIARTWMDQSQWGRIVKTYAKLGPRELMNYFTNICSFPRKRLMVDVYSHLPNFTLDQESIQGTIRVALNERMEMSNLPSFAEHDVGGVVDFGDERDLERFVYGKDGSLNGGLPAGVRYRRAVSQWSPRGDDGRYLEDRIDLERAYGSHVRVAPSHWELMGQQA